MLALIIPIANPAKEAFQAKAKRVTLEEITQVAVDAILKNFIFEYHEETYNTALSDGSLTIHEPLLNGKAMVYAEVQIQATQCIGERFNPITTINDITVEYFGVDDNDGIEIKTGITDSQFAASIQTLLQQHYD